MDKGRATPQFSEGCNTIYAAHRDAVSGGWIDFPLPQDIGAGRICSLGTSGPVTACEHRMLFSRNVSFADEGPSRSVNVGFCVGSEVEWTAGCSTARKVTRSVGSDSLFIQSGNREPRSICYLQGLEYDFVNLQIPLGIGGQSNMDGDIGAILDGADGFESPMTPAMRTSLTSLRHNAFVGRAGRLYAEGKILELLASVVAMLDTNSQRESSGVSKSDCEAAEQAKLILDSRLIDPPTYPELARMACLSESKLSRVFKQVYGTTIHAYVIDHRLEWARALIEVEGLSVAQAAATVGYANPSHFSQAFKDHYGVSPSGI
ncbi:helix-turn-helix domain-containing protein [Slackia exigua]|uniref:helix-turn-helix domain-containing protein n=1 Tax=Slackia exigua TaxID=84109 RepID=UPI00210F136A|nr:AraC family transcriptional regulator [Slackia exigua]